MECKKFSICVTVQYRDVDSAGHVNNAVYLHYLEELRMAFLRGLYGSYSVHDIDFVLAGLTIDYHSRAAFGQQLVVEMTVTKVGKTSWSFAYEIRDKATGTLIVGGTSAQVLFDYTKGCKMDIPEKLRAKLRELLP